MDSASHCQPCLSRNTKLENSKRSIVTGMMVKSHTSDFHLHQLRVIISGGFVKNILHFHLQIRGHHFCYTTSRDADSLSFIAVLEMRNGTSTVWLLTWRHSLTLLSCLSPSPVSVSSCLQHYPTFALSFFYRCPRNANEKSPFILLLKMETRLHITLMLIRPPSPSNMSCTSEIPLFVLTNSKHRTYIFQPLISTL